MAIAPGNIGPFFSETHIVGPDFVPTERCVIADMRLDGVESHNLQRGNMVHALLEMQWSFAIRPTGAEEYIFSFTGSGSSDDSYRTLNMGLEQMVRSGLSGLLGGWTEKEVSTSIKTYFRSSRRGKPRKRRI